MEIYYAVYITLLSLNAFWAGIKCLDKGKFEKANISLIGGIAASVICITLCLMDIGNENLDIPRMVIIVIGQFNFTHLFQFNTYEMKGF